MFASKIVPESEKTILWKRASRLHEVLILKDLDPTKPSQNRWQINRKIVHFFDWKKYRKIIENDPRNASTNHPKRDQKTHRKINEKMIEKKALQKPVLANEREARYKESVSHT